MASSSAAAPQGNSLTLQRRQRAFGVQQDIGPVTVFVH
jgi:hypothetical protein